MLRADIIALVEHKLDEISPFDEGEVASSDLIDGLLDKGTNEILLKVPLHLLTPSNISLTGQVHNSTGEGYLRKPDDFLRLHSMQMSDWDRVVDIAYPYSHPMAKRQNYANIKGGNTKPVVILKPLHIVVGNISQGIHDVLYYYSGTGTHTVLIAQYIPEIVAQDLQDGDTNDGMDLTDVLSYQIAGNFLLITNEPDAAKLAFAKVEQFINENKL